MTFPGETLNANDGADLTVRRAPAVCVKPPPVQVIDIVELPMGVTLSPTAEVAMPRVVDTPEAVGTMLTLPKDPAAPNGKPLNTGVIDPLKPLIEVNVTVYVAVAPWATVADGGDSVTENEGVGTVLATLPTSGLYVPPAAPHPMLP